MNEIILPINGDITKYILSEYLWISDLNELSKSVKDLFLNPKRVKKVKKKTSSVTAEHFTLCDNILSHKVIYKHHIKIYECYYDTLGKKHGYEIHVANTPYFGDILMRQYYFHGILISVSREFSTKRQAQNLGIII
jgi:hypothetical protein